MTAPERQSSGLLIRGFGVRVPGGAPVLTWRYTRFGALKPAIPAKSKWFSLAASHPNWLTLDHPQLSMALATSTGVQPTMTPDPLWAENTIARYSNASCQRCLLKTTGNARSGSWTGPPS